MMLKSIDSGLEILPKNEAKPAEDNRIEKSKNLKSVFNSKSLRITFTLHKKCAITTSEIQKKPTKLYADKLRILYT